MKDDPLILTSAAGLTLLFVVPLLWILSPPPSIFYPLPILMVIPALLGLGPAAAIIPVLIFFFGSPGLLKGSAKVPERSYILLGTATLLTIPYFFFGWKDGVEFEGRSYCFSVLAINIAWLIGLWAVVIRNRNKEQSFQQNLFLHWMLFAWFASYAFPYLGELP